MKRARFLLILLLLVLLTACSSKPYAVVNRGQYYTVDPAARTVTDGVTVYHYEINGDQLVVTFPNGNTMTYGGGVAYGTGPLHSNGFDFLNAPDFRQILEDELPDDKPGFLIFLLAAAGIWNIVHPRSAWYVSRGWEFKDAEPSEAALVVGQLGGAVAVIAALVLLFS